MGIIVRIMTEKTSETRQAVAFLLKYYQIMTEAADASLRVIQLTPYRTRSGTEGIIIRDTGTSTVRRTIERGGTVLKVLDVPSPASETSLAGEEKVEIGYGSFDRRLWPDSNLLGEASPQDSGGVGAEGGPAGTDIQ